MKLVHKSLTSWFSAICAVSIALSTAATAQTPAAPEYVAYYNPETGFKPAQTSLTQIFLQMAGSLEHHGSPEPYIRHMQAEHKRVSSLYEQKTGKLHKGRMPAHMTDEYLQQFVSNWNALSPRLGLDTFAKEIGRCAREGIRGTRNTGTIAIEIFNQHQDLVIEGMKSGAGKGNDFERLRSKIKTELEFDKPSVTLVGYETQRRDAVRYALIIEGRFHALDKKIDAALPTEQATELKNVMHSFFMDLCELAHSELEIGMLNWSLQ